MRRQRGSGSVYQRATDGRWVGRIELPRERGAPRVRRTFYGHSEADVTEKLAAIVGEVPERPPLGSRDTHMANARALGDHTRKEWTAKLATLPRIDRYFIHCHYCEVVVHAQRIDKDHYIPVSRGGSNGLDNVVPACRPCNRSKGNMSGDAWLAYLGKRSWDGIEATG